MIFDVHFYTHTIEKYKHKYNQIVVVTLHILESASEHEQNIIET